MGEWCWAGFDPNIWVKWGRLSLNPPLRWLKLIIGWFNRGQGWAGFDCNIWVKWAKLSLNPPLRWLKLIIDYLGNWLV